jgi:subtilisin-like proprotein convertase family protein
MRQNRTVARLAVLALTGLGLGAGLAAAGLGAGAAAGATGAPAQPGVIVIPVLGVAAPYPSTLAVSGLPNGIVDVNVTLAGLTHSYPADLEIMVVGPGGQHVVLLNDAGAGDDVNDLTLTFDDEAAGKAPQSQLATGSYQASDYAPADLMTAPAPSTADAAASLAAFDGTNPNGTWTLYVEDQDDSDSGVIARGWSLALTTADPPAAPVITAPVSGSRDQDGAFTMAGSAPAATTVKVYDGATLAATTTASASGTWSTAVSGVPNGSHTFTATSTDSLTNTSAPSAAVVVIVDSIKPRIMSTVPTKGAKHAGVRANIRAKASEALRTSTVTKAHAFIVVAGTTTHLKAKVTWKSGTGTIVINPKAHLAHGTKYKVTITTRVLDLAGNRLDQNRTKAGLQKKTWKFTTR